MGKVFYFHSSLLLTQDKGALVKKLQLMNVKEQQKKQYEIIENKLIYSQCKIFIQKKNLQ